MKCQGLRKHSYCQPNRSKQAKCHSWPQKSPLFYAFMSMFCSHLCQKTIYIIQSFPKKIMLHCSIKIISKHDEEQGYWLFWQKGCACATFECRIVLLEIAVFSCKSNFNQTDDIYDMEIFTFIAHPAFAM